MDATAANVGAPADPLARRTRPSSLIGLRDAHLALLKASHGQFRKTLDNFEAAEAAQELYTGTGIVTVAGGEYFGPAIVGIKMLRQTG